MVIKSTLRWLRVKADPNLDSKPPHDCCECIDCYRWRFKRVHLGDLVTPIAMLSTGDPRLRAIEIKNGMLYRFCRISLTSLLYVVENGDWALANRDVQALIEDPMLFLNPQSLVLYLASRGHFNRIASFDDAV